MYIEELKLKSFKGFKDYTLTCSPFMCLAGLNNGGKTSILQAVRLLQDIIEFTFGGNERPDFSTPRWQSDPTYGLNRLNSGDPDAVWLEKKMSEPCVVSAKYTGGVEVCLQINGRHQYGLDILLDGQSIKSTLNTSDGHKVVEDLFAMRPAYLPSVAAVSPVEEYRSEPRMKAELDRGSDAGCWRCHLYWLWNDGDKSSFNAIVDRVKRYLPEAHVLPPRLNHEDPAKVMIEFRENDTVFDISTSGGGLRALLNLATALHFSNSKCFLADEPDSHLHPSLQRNVSKMLTDHTTDKDCQVIVTSHSPDFIAEVPTEFLVWVDRSKTGGIQCMGVGEVLVDLGSVTKTDAVRAYGADKVLFVEGDDDRDILGKMMDRLPHPNPFRDPKVMVAKLTNGRGDASHLRAHQSILRATLKLDVDIACIVDHDYQKPPCATEEGGPTDGPLVLSLRRKEIENYLLDEKVIYAAIQSLPGAKPQGEGTQTRGPSIDEIRAQVDSILEAPDIRTLVRYHLIGPYRDSLPGSLDSSTRERRADDWFERLWSDRDSRLALCPGKKVLKRIREWCQAKFGLTLTPKVLTDAVTTPHEEIACLAQRISAYFYGGTPLSGKAPS